MSKPRLIYFDAPVSRGEECRLALHIGGVDFEDVRVGSEEWAALKDKSPFGSLPVLEMPGQPALGQSNAILAFVGRRYDLHPKNEFEAARHEAMMCHVEDLRAAVGPTLHMTDAAEKKKAREAFAESYVPAWSSFAERQIDDEGPFFAGSKLHVVDLKIHRVVHWFASGTMDYIPATVYDAFPKLKRIYEAVREHAGVKSWNLKKR